MVQPPAPAASPDATARQLASELFVLGFPLILMDAIRRAHPLAASRFRLFPPASQALVPGLFHDDPDCLHSSAIVDLATGPSLLHLPNTHGRYISVTLIDSSGEAFASLGSRNDDHLAGDVMLAGPAWHGQVRDGLRALRAPCDTVWAVSRIIARSAPDRHTVEGFAGEQSFTPISRTPPPPPDEAPGTTLDVLDLAAIHQLAEMEPPALFHRLLQLVDRAPQAVRERLSGAVRERLALLDAKGLGGVSANELLLRGFADGWNAIQAARRGAAAEPVREWTSATPAAGFAGPVERAAAVLGALGAPRPEDILTLRCNADESGRPLTGEEQYRLAMSAHRLPPALSAWRLTAPGRERQTSGDVIGDHSPLVTAPGGSLELLVQREPPLRRQQVNWLRAPDGPFELYLRLYSPTADTLDGTWRMTAVERLGSRDEGRLARLVRRGTAPPPKPRNLQFRSMEHAGMTRSSLALAGLVFVLAAGAATAQSSGQPSAPVPATTSPTASADASASIDPAATAALRQMRTFMSGLNTFEVKTDGSLDLVLDDGQKVQLDGQSVYRVRRPNGFEIKTSIGNKVRDYYYDGQKMTVFAPQLGYYAQAPAPATIRETLDEAYEKYGISFPLEDLFQWAEREEPKKGPITSAMVVGDATIDGTPTTQYAFRQGEVDWQVWIQKGAQPLPRKIVIVDRSDDARPAYSVRLAWTLNPTLAADAFTFRPGANAKQIQIAAAQ